MPITMNLMRPNHLLSSLQYRTPIANKNNGMSFHLARPVQGLQFRSSNIFNVGLISNVVNSKPGCGSCGK